MSVPIVKPRRKRAVYYIYKCNRFYFQRASFDFKIIAGTRKEALRRFKNMLYAMAYKFEPDSVNPQVIHINIFKANPVAPEFADVIINHDLTLRIRVSLLKPYHFSRDGRILRKEMNPDLLKSIELLEDDEHSEKVLRAMGGFES